MNLAIDISQIAYKGTGVSRFVDGLTRAILENDKNNRWTFFYSSLRQELPAGLKDEILGKKHKLASYKLPPTALSILWNSLHRMKIEKLVGKMDWIITSDWTEPPSKMSKATVIHDLAYIRYPETVHPVIRKTQAERMRWVKKESKLIFADSQATRKDIVELLHIPENKIVVNYPGVEIKTVDDAHLSDTKQRFNLNRPFLLTVGTIEPRKNLKRLIDAYKNLHLNNIDLVVVGNQGWDTQTSKKQSEEHNIKFLGYVSEDDLLSLYRLCLLFVYPSLYEGFGYPIVEAMMSGAPVATSYSSSMSELGNDAAAFFKPENTDNIAAVLKELIHDQKLRENYTKKGIIKGREFSWKRYFDIMISALEGSGAIN